MKTKQMPKNWEEVELGEITSIDSGQGAPQGEKYFQGKKRFVRAGDLNNLTKGIYVGDYCEKITDKAIEEYNLKKYKKDSIVFPKSGMSIKTDNIALLKYDSYVVNHLAIIKPSEKVNTLFLYYLLKRKKISNLSTNSSYPSIRLSDIRKHKIPLPPLKTQKKIVEILEKVETLKQKREESNKLTDEYLKSVFYEMFLKDREKWEEVEFGKFADITSSKRIYQKEYVLEGIPFYRSKEIIELSRNREVSVELFISKKRYNELKKKFSVPKKGDLLITAVGTIGKIYVIPNKEEFYFKDGNLLWIKNLNNLNSIYLSDFLSHHFKKNKNKFSSGSAYNALTIVRLKKLKIPLPPLELQKKFASIVEHVEKLKGKQKKNQEDLEELFNALMQKAFKGELV